MLQNTGKRSKTFECGVHSGFFFNYFCIFFWPWRFVSIITHRIFAIIKPDKERLNDKENNVYTANKYIYWRMHILLHIIIFR